MGEKPLSFREAIATDDSHAYKKAMDTELSSVEENRVWEVPRYQVNPGEFHITAATRILRYLKKITRFGSSNEIPFYSDASHGSCSLTRKATSGYLIFLAGSPVSWYRRAKVWSAKVRLKASTSPSQRLHDGVWLKGLTQEIGFSSTPIQDKTY